MRVLSSMVIVAVGLVLAGFAFVHSGLYNVTALEEHTPLTSWALHTTMENSVEARAADITIPANLSSATTIRRGARAYDQLCAACHLKPGLDSTLLRQGLNPTPPSLTKEGHFSPAEQFWVIKNGIKMSGMPAWGATHDDEALWEITAFLQQLPGLSAPEYRRLVATESGKPQTDDGHDHDHGDMQSMMGPQTTNGEARHHTKSSSHEGDHTESGNPQRTASEPAAGSSQADDHYADGHTH